ncbi:WD repeat- and FYVE domain-containing protein 4 isoform X2 [Synchiropus splendidus]|uniref:WD repeat- and FYVE domain-containing protein 4 isoform X2 n=1 Tax=Synchiropus splendidus TaxID=270530 RepID=UPI00237E13FD|nr:WD repeat- and FYVE domain-containing protein 4 isoform X2 [Synchiropus splendidus]
MAVSQKQVQTSKKERINKETGELSASGEVSVSLDLKVVNVEGSRSDPQPLEILQELLRELDIHKCSTPDHDTEHDIARQREALLVEALSVLVQVGAEYDRLDQADVEGLAVLIADSVVFNIHSRLGERPAEVARDEVVNFFRKSDESSNLGVEDDLGWLLLKSLLLLTAGSSDILTVLNPGLPATLGKCLYLLVCIPAKTEKLTLEETFQELLTQVLVQLCRLPELVENLVETQEVQCLIIGLTSLWDQTSHSWRHQASRVLRAISAAGTSNITPTLLGKNCIRICIQNLLHIRAEVSGPLLSEVAVAVFSFIRDTYKLSPDLFNEFDSHNGYQALESILKCCKDGVPADQFQPVEELLALIASFTTFGKSELKVALCISNPQPPGFKFDSPLTKGSSVKNLPAFNLLQNLLLSSQDSPLCCQILRNVQTIWEWDTANFFLLEWTVQTMSQLTACIWIKPPPVQRFYFSMLEMIILKLNYIPHETLRAVLGLLKQTWSGNLISGLSGVEFGVLALQFLYRLTLHSGLVAEVLTDWGLLELVLGELRRRAKILRKARVTSAPLHCLQQVHLQDGEQQLTICMLQVVSTLTLRSIKSTVVVRERGMVPYIKIFLDADQYRRLALSILEQLAEINPDEFMSTAIGALCSSTQQELSLKQDLLKSVLKVLENPNSWDAFRRAGGFAGLLSLVVDMEGALADPPIDEVWKCHGHEALLDLLLLTLHILAVAVHHHTVNAHHFQTGGFYEKLAEALHQVGCFHSEGLSKWAEEERCFSSHQEGQISSGKSFDQFVDLAEASKSQSPSGDDAHPELPQTLRTCIRLLSYLDQFATGMYSTHNFTYVQETEGCDGNKEKPTGLAGNDHVYSYYPARQSSVSMSSGSSETPYRFTCDHVVLHPGALRVFVTLLPVVFTTDDPLLSMEVQLSLANHILAVVRSERNRQIMCEGGLIPTLLLRCRRMLLMQDHPLHLPVTCILEKLSSQAITPADFRKFLCLGEPLLCSMENAPTPPVPDQAKTTEANPAPGPKRLKRTISLLRNESSVGRSFPPHQLISLVSMTSPRSFRSHRVSSSPAFVEFDMSESGYGCLFLPTVATVKGVSADSIPTGGIGGDCRGFPPTAGLTFSCWFQISRFSSACDSHPIRLLTIVRHMSRTEQQYVCLSISFSACDGCLVISTEEEAFTYLDMMEPEVGSPTSLPTALRLRCSSLLVPGQWHHLAVILTKGVKKSCLTSAYFNGKALGSGKMRYIPPFPGQYVSMDPTAVIDVYGLIGTPAFWKEHAALVWRVGPSYLFEEPLSSEAVGVIYSQGTTYLGNFLALRNAGQDLDGPSARLVPEERISFGINLAISTSTTVAQIRRDYNEVDCRLIAKEMGITSRDESSPVFLARNISQHLNGTARTIGAALVGHFGVRTFTPHTASNGFFLMGGPEVVLSLVAMAPDDSSLYAAVKILQSVLETNSAMQLEMNRISGFKILAFLLKMKNNLVRQRTLQLVMHLCSSVELSPSSLGLSPAFQALLLNLEVWQNTSENLDLAVLKHFVDLLSSSRDDGKTVAAMHRLDLIPKLLFQLSQTDVTFEKVKLISCVATSLLKNHFTTLDVKRLGVFLLWTLPPSSITTPEDFHLSCEGKAQSLGPASVIWIRNQLLLVLCDILCCDSPEFKTQQTALFDALGSDWFLFFLMPHLHQSTVELGLVLLTHFLSSSSQLSNFREVLVPGTIIRALEEPCVVMDNLRAHHGEHECFSRICQGFEVLQGLLLQHCHLPPVYEALACLLLGRKASHTREAQLGLDRGLQLLIDSQGENPAVQLCVEAATIMLELIKVIVTQKEPGEGTSQEPQLPASVMQFFCLLHNCRPRDPLWRAPEFLHMLAAIVFPNNGSEENLQNGECFSPKKPVYDFIQILLMDSFLNVSVDSSSHPLVLLLEFAPDGASFEQQKSFQTKTLELIMNIIHILHYDEQNCNHLISQDQRSDTQTDILMENVVLFCKTLPLKLYSGTFLGDPECLLHFLADQIVVALEQGQTQKEKMVSALYSCTNKVLLHLLSLPRQSQEEKEVIIRTLQTLEKRWDVIMATYNANVNFVTCLLHCLLLIRSDSYVGGFGLMGRMQSFNKTTKDVLLRNKTSPVNGVDSAKDEMIGLAKVCWVKVMKERQQILEDTYKIEISASQGNEKRPVSMTDISPLWEETSLKAWKLLTEEMEKKMTAGSQNTFDRITTVVRSALGKQSRETVTVADFLSCMESHRQRGHSMYENMRTSHSQVQASEWKCLNTKWLRVETELLRERAVFGPGPGVFLKHDWVQDAVEGPNRTRCRIRRNTLRLSKQVLGNLCIGLRMGASDEYSLKEHKILCEVGAEVKEKGDDGRQEDCDHLTFFPVLNDNPAVSECPLDPSAPEPCSHSPDCPEILVILQELHPGEEVNAKMCVVMVSGLKVSEGVLLFGKESLFICEGFTLSPCGDVCCRKHHPSSVKDSYISSMLSKELTASCKHWLYEDIKEARFLRFLLEDNAIEVFMKNGHSALLVFLNRDHVSAYKRLCRVAPALKGRGTADVLANAKKTPVVEKTSLVKWQRGEISNFEYLMHLNTLAGRTYNDLMQYPVFPWVLADYHSETLDLSNPATFRDLSKPMGAQTEKRKLMFTRRYEDMANSAEEGDLPAPCHYCTHYSSAIIVSSFLVRMEPFSHTFRTLQGGFDVPERMFHSIRLAWESASRDNMTDVRELVPEFFYLPDFLQNSNHMELGCLEDGTALGDVELPPWAKDDPQEFIRVQREALESDYVSSQLHLWIDLIFGYRQQGPTAVESVNTFHPYYYAQRGRQDVKDPLIKKTILGYVSNFGQIPKQLFTKPHPPRSGTKKEASSQTFPSPFFYNLDRLRTMASPLRELPRGPVGQILCLEKEVLVLERNRLLLSPQLSCYFSWGFPDNTCAFGNYSTDKTFGVCESLSDWGETLCAACPNPTTVVTAGSSTVVCVWDVAINKDKLTHMKLRQPLYGHTDAVTCLTTSEVHSLIVSGSRDLTCILWDLEELRYVTQLVGHKSSVSALAINELTGEIASCAGPLLYLWSMKGQLLACIDTMSGPGADILCVAFTQKDEWDSRNVVVTGCADGVIRIWRTEYARTQLPGPPEEPASPGHDQTAQAERDARGWRRHLVLCQELSRSQTQSTRRSKVNPAITALAMSRSHVTLLAGDAWGRVFTWISE